MNIPINFDRADQKLAKFWCSPAFIHEYLVNGSMKILENICGLAY